MNQVFDWGRFSRLVGSHFRKNVKRYLISCLVLAGVTISLFVLVISSTRDKVIPIDGQFFVYLMATYGGLLIFTAGIFQPFQRRREGPFQLMLPASGFEKFLVGWSISFVGYALCANAVFFAVRYLVVQYYSMWGYEAAGLTDYEQLLDSHEKVSTVWLLVMAYVFFHAFALCGSLAFRKLAVLKTALALFLVILAYWAVNGILYRSLFQLDIQQRVPLLPLTSVSLQKGGIFYHIDIPDWPYWLLALAVAVIGLLWVASYHKLREKEA